MMAAERAASHRSPVPRAEPPSGGKPWTVLRLMRWSGSWLERKGVAQGRLDAEHLLAHALGVRRLDLYLQYDRPLTADELAPFRALLRRRARREPLQHVLGRAPFREIELRTDSRALVPRPETEELVGVVLDWASKGGGGGAGAPGAVLEIGTGTGAIALSLAREGGFRPVLATDTSAPALELAAENAREAGLVDAVTFRRGNLFEPIRAGERFRVVVSNPPYIPEGEWSGLPPEVRDWDPRAALVAGPTGLEVLRELIRGAPRVLHDGGLLALEVGRGQAGEVAELARATAGLEGVWVRRDLQGVDRIVLAERADERSS